MRRSFFVFAAFLVGGTASFSSGASAQSSSDDASNAEKRIERLEEQIVDLNAQLGTIQTMSQSGGSLGAPSASTGGSFGSGGPDTGRLEQIETQVRALSSQLSDVLNRLDRIERRSGGLSPSLQQDPGSTDYGSASRSTLDAQPAEQGTGFSVGGSSSGGFGATIENDGIGGASAGNLSAFSNPGSSAPAPATIGNPQPVATASQSTPEAQALYKKGYDALVQRSYRVAADQFEQFVSNFPQDPLAGPAYFWLGEAAFTNGQYKTAADSFLKSSTNYPNNEKAAESLLKLGISLKRLGEAQAACSSFSELGRRYPNATQLLERAEREKSRAQC